MIRRTGESGALAFLLLASPALGQVDPFEFEVYPYQTEGKGMLEMESLNSFVAQGHSQGDSGTSSGDFPSEHMYRSTIEVTYGLTEKIEFAAYLTLAHPNGDTYSAAIGQYDLELAPRCHWTGRHQSSLTIGPKHSNRNEPLRMLLRRR